MIGVPFGAPRPPFKPCTETARRAGKKGKAKSPWAKTPMFSRGRLNERGASQGAPNAGNQR